MSKNQADKVKAKGGSVPIIKKSFDFSFTHVKQTRTYTVWALGSYFCWEGVGHIKGLVELESQALPVRI